MPVIIFLAQRLILFLLAILTFAGLSSEERYFAVEQSFAIERERKPEIAEILEQDSPDIINVTPKNFELDVQPIRDSTPSQPTTPTTPIQETPKRDLPTDFIDNVVQGVVEIKESIIGESAKVDPVTPQEPTQQPGGVTPSVPAKSDTATKSSTIANTPRNAVLNIVCLERNGRSLSLTTGSGVIISKDGYVLTNAHVAQFMLNQDKSNVDCELKHPDNAGMNFRAAVQYIPEEWKNNGKIGSTTGTGERDYAILKIVGPGPTGIMLSHFPFIDPETNDKFIEIGNDILLIAYPGKNTGNFDVDGNLPIVTDISLIQDVFTFGTTAPDVFSSGVTPVAKQGSSGGAVVDDGKLLGIIVTTNETALGTVLNAISLDYINRDLKSAGLSLNQFR